MRQAHASIEVRPIIDGRPGRPANSARIIASRPREPVPRLHGQGCERKRRERRQPSSARYRSPPVGSGGNGGCRFQQHGFLQSRFPSPEVLSRAIRACQPCCQSRRAAFGRKGRPCCRAETESFPCKREGLPLIRRSVCMWSGRRHAWRNLRSRFHSVSRWQAGHLSRSRKGRGKRTGLQRLSVGGGRADIRG